MWSTSNYHHVNPPVSAVVKCKMVDLDCYGLKSQDVLVSTVSTQSISTSPLLKSPVSAVTKHCVRWLQLMWTQSAYLMANPHLSVKWNLSNSPGNLHLRYQLPIAQSWRLTETVKLCVLQGRTDGYSSWLFGQCWIQYHCQELMYIINQEKTPLQMDITAAMLSLTLYRIILPHLCF